MKRRIEHVIDRKIGGGRDLLMHRQQIILNLFGRARRRLGCAAGGG